MSKDIDSLHGKPTAGGDMPQRRLGKYELLRPLGRGGMGEVWLARDTVAEVEVALKMLPPELRYNDEAQEQIRTSYQRVHKLGHPNICAVKDLVLDPGGAGLFLVMDYFDGITLSKYRSLHVSQHGTFPVAEVVRLLEPAAAAFDYAHSVSLAHRDIKPANILVSSDGQQVRVIDFQLAAEIRATVSRFTKLQVDTSGTYPYMAPEQFRGARSTAASDLYAFAMTTYELLAGELPFETMGWEMWKAIVIDPNTTIPDVSGLSPSGQAALVRSLSPDPKQRATSCRAFLASLTEPVVSPKDHQPTGGAPPIAKPLAEAPVIVAPAIPQPAKMPSLFSDSSEPTNGELAKEPLQHPGTPRTNPVTTATPQPKSGSASSPTVKVTPGTAELPKKKRTSLAFKLGLASSAIMSVMLLIPAVQHAREAARRDKCKNNLKQIGIAMHNYQDTFSRLPAAHLNDSQGQPRLSWRTSILAYVDEAPRYNQYNFNEAWDGPSNSQLLSPMPSVYSCPTHAATLGTESVNTSYATITGDHTALGAGECFSLYSMTDGTSNTLMVVEACHLNIPWMKPKDIEADSVKIAVSTDGISSKHTDGSHILMGDGTVRFLSAKTDPSVIKALITRDGNEVPVEF